MHDLLAVKPSGDTISVVVVFGVFALVANLIAYYKGFFTLPKTEDKRYWTFVQTVVCFGIYLLVSYLVGPLVFSFVVHTAQKISPKAFSEIRTKIMVLQAITGILNFSFLALYLNWQDRRFVRALFKDPSMKHTSIFTDVLMGIFTWFIAFPGIVAINHICDYINKDLFKVKAVDQVAVRYLKMSTGSYATFIIAIIVIIIVAPVIEEFIFRGCIQNFLRRKIGAKASIIVTALFFAFMHFSISQKASNFPLITSLFAFSLYLGFIYEKTRSLISPIVLHLTFNAVSVVRILMMITSS